MIDLRPEDALHKSYMDRLLIEIIDNSNLSQSLAFKGGSAAAMLGFLDRFSVDLDFDLMDKSKAPELREEFHAVFDKVGVALTKEFKDTLFFQVKYPNENKETRSTVKVGAHDLPVAANEYTVGYLKEIDRLMKCQTIETMFANKLVALTDRYAKYKTIAGRDIYDIHHFLVNGYKYKGAVIRERTGLDPKDYLVNLTEFIRRRVTQIVISEDLNPLLPSRHFQQIRKVLLPETIFWLENEQRNQMRMQ